MENAGPFYSLTHPQQRILYTEKLHPGTSMFSIAGTLKMTGDIDFDLLDKAVNCFIKANDSIRLRLTEDGGTIKQRISEYEYKRIDFFDFTGKGIKALYDWDKEQIKIPHELFDTDLYYFALLKVNDREGRIYTNTHHSIADAWSIIGISNYIFGYYAKLKMNIGIEEVKKPSYIEFIQTEQDYMNSEKFIKDKMFWNEKFSNFTELTTLKPRKNNNYLNTEAKRKTFVLPAKLTPIIRNFCSKTNMSVFSVFLSALSIYINRITDNVDLVFGTPVLNRTNFREKETVGMYISTVPLRIGVDDSSSFTDFVKYITSEWISILKHQKYPYDILLKDLRESDKSIEKLYDITLSFQNAKFEKYDVFDKQEGRWHFSGYQVDSLSIHVNDREDSGHLIIDYDYLTSQYTLKEIKYIHDHLLNILWDALANPEKKLYEMEILSDEERIRILYDFNRTAITYPTGETVHSLFEKRVKANPDAMAVKFGDTALTYNEFDRKSNRIARQLRKFGIGSNKVVGLLMHRSEEIPIAVMGILKAGGVYMPIDPDCPADRIDYMLQDSEAAALIVNGALKGCASYAGNILCLDDPEASEANDGPVKDLNKPADIVYIIYTSGSTGKPKAVMIKHDSVVNFVHAVSKFMDFSCGNIVLAVTTISFDISIFEYLPTLLNGGTLVVANEEEMKNPLHLSRLISRMDINKILTTPSRMHTLLSDEKYSACLRNVKEIMLGGEVFPKLLLKKLKTVTDAVIFNGYGPTEITIGATFKNLTQTNSINIGKPIGNTRAYILDQHLNAVPIGVHGELCISGYGLASGYMNNPMLTSEKFVDNPFEKDAKMYKTGDLARWYAMGEIEYLGRIDQQVKIKGYRIEPGEIETAIASIEGMDKAVVIDRDDSNGKKYLCCYYASKACVTPQQIKSHLVKQLPAYMIPLHFVKMDSIPINASGKLNRYILPEVDVLSGLTNEYEPPTNDGEQRLAEIWKDLLKVDKIGIFDDFFELGGDSLLMVSMASEIFSKMNVEITLEDIYKNSNIKCLADCIQNSSIEQYTGIKRIPDREYYELSSSQKRLFILDQLENGGTIYNMPAAFMIDGDFDADRFIKAVKSLISRHESLRTSFCVIDSQPVQKIHDTVPFEIKIQKTGEFATSGKLDKFLSGLIQPFDLGKAPLMRCELFKINNTKWILFFDFHHIISDGASAKILMREMAALYRGEVLPEPELRYVDYADWQVGLLKSGKLDTQREYWTDMFDGDPTSLNFPTDFNRPPAQSFEGDTVSMVFSAPFTKKIKNMAQQTNTTLNMLLLSAYYVLLSKYTGQSDIVVGQPVIGRGNSEIKDIPGVFINTLAMRNYPEGGKNFTEFLGEVKERSLNGYQFQMFPFEELISSLKLQRDLGRNPLFDTMFIKQDADTQNMTLEGVKTTALKVKTGKSKLDFSLEVIERNGELHFTFEYCTKLFKKDTIKALCTHYRNLVRDVIKNSKKEIKDIEILSENEKKRLLYEFNETQMKYKHDITINKLFEEQAGKYPDSTAVIFGDERLTYVEFNRRVNRLANYLRNEADVKPDSIVGVMIRRSIDMLMAFMAVIKAGGAYLPVDPDYPKNRIEYMLSDSKASVLLTQEEFKGKTGFKGHEIIVAPGAFDEYSEENPENVNSPENLLYVIYTSGSTGKPKGVMLIHQSVSNLISGVAEVLNLQRKTLFVSLTTVSFDIFVTEFIVALVKGLCVVIASEAEQKMPELMNRLMIKNGVKIMQATPSRMQMMLEDTRNLDYFEKLELLLFVGEPLGMRMVQKLKGLTKARIINFYGPTETTVYSTVCDVTDRKSITIGRPLANTQIYILDKNGNPVPQGITGEIFIAGDGLGRGYIGRDDLTRERYVRNPFMPNTRMYKTGDLGRWTPDGEIEHLGRNDYQIKIRGYRIELDEIQKVISGMNKVKDAVVIAIDDTNGDKRLQAFVVAEAGKKIEGRDIKEYLTKQLPDFMIPSNMRIVECLPMTPVGKIDRTALAALCEDGAQQPDEDVVFTVPKNDVEEKLLDIWKEALKADRISTSANFFEIGGNSLAVIMAHIKTYPMNWDLSAQDFYKYQTIRQMALKINGAESQKNMKEIGVAHLEALKIDIGKLKSMHDACTNDGTKYRTMKNVLLTGGTGFLGMHLLQEILNTTDTTVYCLVRAGDSKAAFERLLHMMNFYFGKKYNHLAGIRIIPVKGNISSEKMGVSEKMYTNLCECVDAVFHCAANVRHFGHYDEFKKVNVDGTKHVIDFCREAGAVMNHISTASIASGYAPDSKDRIFSEKDLYIGQNYSDNVYVRSKFEAEILVFKAMEEGLKARVIRIGNLTGRSTDGLFQQNIGENAFYGRIKSFIKIGAIPKSMAKFKIELSPVDMTGRAILKLCIRPETLQRALHVLNNKTMNVGTYVNILNRMGYDIKIIEDEKFNSHIEKFVADKDGYKILQSLINDVKESTQNKDRGRIIINTGETDAQLAAAGFEWPTNQDAYVEKIMRYIAGNTDFLNS